MVMDFKMKEKNVMMEIQQAVMDVVLIVNSKVVEMERVMTMKTVIAALKTVTRLALIIAIMTMTTNEMKRTLVVTVVRNVFVSCMRDQVDYPMQAKVSMTQVVITFIIKTKMTKLTA